MSGNLKLFIDLKKHGEGQAVTLADGSQSNVQGIGNIDTGLPLKSVLYIPSLSYNLLSVSKITKDLNCSIEFFPETCVFQDLITKQIIGKGYESRGLYIWENSPIACTSMESAIKLHQQLDYPSLTLFNHLYPQYNSITTLDCEPCQYAKLHRSSLKPRINKCASAPFELVHSDIWGPSPIVSKSGYRYFVTFVDDYSRVTWLFLMKNRSELFSIFCTFHEEIQNQFKTCIKTLRSDNAKEYTSHIFSSYLSQHGIIHETSCVDTAAQNGVAERKNRHLLETARALMFQMNVPKSF